MLDRPEEFHVDKMCNFIPTTYAGDISLEVEEETVYGFKLLGCNILDNQGSLLTRKHYDLKGNNYLNHHIQNFLYTIVGKYITLIYIKAMLFTSIYWRDADDHCSIVEAIP